MSAIIDQVRRLLHPLQVRLANTIARAVVRVVDDDNLLQVLQLSGLAGETLGGVERFQEYGFTGTPPADGKAEALVVFVGANRDHPVVVGLEHRPTRPKNLPAGTVVLYNSSDGTRITLDPDGRIRIDSPLELVLTAPDITLDGELAVTGDAEIGGISFGDLVAAYNSHTHTDPQGGSTGPPSTTV